MSVAEISKDRKLDAKVVYLNYHTHYVPTVLDLAKPSQEMAVSIVNLMEEQIELAKRTAALADSAGTAANAGDKLRELSLLSRHKRAKLGKQTIKSTLAPESFVLFVAKQLKHRLTTAADADIRDQCQLVLPVVKHDYMPDDSDDMSRIDIGLVCASTNAEDVAKPKAAYRELFAVVVEAKRVDKDAEREGAYSQLYDYTHRVYETQLGRRSVWGLVICGTNVYACYFGPDRAFSSLAMDVSIDSS
ncbi:hypothetical protein GGI19_001259 [Coemansia pectinata]|uniref:Uncharacterized protein n=1 Tax=Coemansia pectinata TaxID=1052879 RepID=A0A9W8LDD4_9FUNG|nr:hypothetical protein GGI19_001259 [Coemansia pectinata]